MTVGKLISRQTLVEQQVGALPISGDSIFSAADHQIMSLARERGIALNTRSRIACSVWPMSDDHVKQTSRTPTVSCIRANPVRHDDAVPGLERER